MKVFVHFVANNQNLRPNSFLMMGGFLIFSLLGYFANNKSASSLSDHTANEFNSTMLAQQYAVAIDESEGNLIDLGNAIGAPDGLGTKFNRGDGTPNTFVVWDMGETIPIGTQVCVSIKLEHCTNSSASQSNLKIWGGVPNNGGNYEEEESHTLNHSNYQEYCFATSQAYKYIKVSDEGGCAFRVEYLSWDNTCDNVTDGGQITGAQSNCGGFDPDPLTNTGLASGGSGAIEYVWLSTTDCSLPIEQWNIIANSNSVDYDPGFLNSTTCFIRCARREGCVDFIGESNQQEVEVLQGCGGEVSDWNYSCEDGKVVDVLGTGLKNGVPASLNFSNPGNIDEIYAEVIYKGGNPGQTVTFYDALGVAYLALREQPGGNSSNVSIYRTAIPATSSISYQDQTAESSAQSLVAYVFRNVTEGAYCTGQFTYQSGYRTTKTLTFDIPTDVEPRDINLEIPVSEMTEDCRILNITATAGSVTQSVTIDGPNPEQGGCCLNIVDIELEDVEANATTVTLVIESPTGSGSGCPSTPQHNGQSFVISGAVKLDVQCIDCENVTDGGSISTNESSCEPFDAALIQNQQSPSGGSGNLEYQWQKSYDSENGPWSDIVGASQATYDPGYEVQTVWYRRNARRAGCSFYLGISNTIVKVVDEQCSCDLFCPGDVILDCNDSTDPNNTGFAAVLCGDGSSNDCERPAGVNTLSNELFESNNTSYSLGQGWAIGSGCNPVCGDGSTVNAFIDFTQFYYSYNRSITSPTLDACCIDEVKIDYCLRQDLFTNGNAPVQELDIEVSVNGGPWNSFVNYQTVNGQTIDYLESNVTVPGAAGNNFRVRFRVHGPGGDFTLGGWGLDNVKIYGNSPGCDEDAPENYNITYVDNTQNTGCGPGQVITRNWTATRFTGETYTCTQLIRIQDNLAPDIISAPQANITVECSAIPDPEDPVFSDACDNNLTLEFDEFQNPSSCEDSYTITRIWKATDDCNNERIVQQTITVQDNTLPTFPNPPSDITISCNENIPVVVIPSAADNCDSNVEVVLEEEINNQTNNNTCTDNNYTIFRIFKATDNCGNVAQYTQEVLVQDLTDPVLLGVPGNQTVECNAVPAPANPSASDNCDNNVDISFNEIADNTNNGTCTDYNYTITRTWTAVDNCGNSVSQTQIITVQNTSNPQIENVPDDLTVSCDNIPAPGSPTATDVCDNFVDVSFSEVSTQTFTGDCTDNNYTIIRTWTATDDCGNESTQAQEIIVEDLSRPTLENLPQDITVFNLPVPAPQAPTAIDNCDGNVTITFEEQAGSGCEYNITRTWTATDNCGNQDVYTQNIFVEHEAEAGSLTINDALICLPPVGNGQVSATFVGNGFVPQGFSVMYVLTRGNNMVIEQLSASPDFFVSVADDYKIHRLVYVSDANDYNYLDLNTIQLGTTEAAEVIALLEQGGGAICASLSAGAMVKADACDASIGDMVFEDLNGNGIMDAGEPGLANVPVSLTGTADDGEDLFFTTTTDENGKYKFENLPPGNYKITFSSPDGYLLTYANLGGNEALDSDADPNNGMTAFEDLDSGEENLDYDAGFYRPAELGNFIWEDKNANGIQNVGEPGLGFVQVTLIGVDGAGNDVTFFGSTDANGLYNFPNLRPGSYKITFGNLAGYVLTYLDEGGDDSKDSDADPNNGMSVFETIVSGESNLTYDAGLYKLAEIGNYVWEDVNGNGIQDNGEPFIPFAPVELTGTTGNGTAVSLTTTTDANGNYKFVNLIPGAYKLTFSAPNNFLTTYANQGGDEALDSDADPITGMTIFEELESDESNLTYDAGFYRAASIGNFVWEDVNGNGVQDAGEPGIENVAVILTGTTGNGTLISLTQTTGSNGSYLFENLVPGDYKLTFNTPNGFEYSYNNFGGDIEKDSDADPNNGGMTNIETLVSGENNDTYDAGFYRPASIGNFVWEDLNGNGLQDNGEPGIANVPVSIVGLDGGGGDVFFTTTTAGNGSYEFAGLRPGEYKITFTLIENYLITPQNEGGDDTSDSDADPDNGMTVFEELVSGENNPDYDAGFFLNATVGDYAWIDCNKNGIQDAGEAPLAFVPVNFSGETGSGQIVDLNTSTDVDGFYIFENIKPGKYKLTFGFPANPLGLAYSPQDQTSDDLDSDVDPNTGMTLIYTIESGETNLDIDAGYMDVSPPVFTGIPTDVIVECDVVPAAPEIGTDITADDNLDTNVDITFSEISTQGTGDNCSNFNYTITRTWIATDDCGNSTEATQVITVQDTSDPVFNGIPDNVTVECDVVPAPANPTVSDNCDNDIDIIYSEVRTDSDCLDNYTLTRTWTATDDCGNELVATQVITVQDTSDPSLIGVPANVTVECSQVPEPAQPTANDNCDNNVDIVFNEVRTNGSCFDSYILTRTWTATDNCGNEIIETQIITVQDVTAPSLDGVPADATVECNVVPTPAQPTASDNCDSNVEITFSEVRTDGNCVDNYTLTRTWTAIDNCGNEDVQTQVIIVQDTTDPDLFGVPADATVECNAVPNPAQPTATDNCDTDVEITFSEVRTDGNCVDTYTLTRTWTATDNCGNEEIQTQIINVQDTTDPELQGVPANTSVECNAIPNPADPTATDNCDADVEITFSEVRTDGNCLDTYTLTRTWTATDNCGNEDIQTQIITVEDTTDPEMTGVPADAIVECDEVPNPASPIATDNCDTDVDISFSEIRTDGNCVDTYTLTRTWTATDNCGNEITQTQIITVQDTSDPELLGVPGDAIVECDNVPSPAQPTATDNCDTDVEITFSENRIDGNCVSNYTLIRTWTAIDNCGNEIEEIQTITVQDTTDPDLFGVPADETVECTDVPTVPEIGIDITASDNCDANVEITFSEIRIDGACENSYTLERTWIATDDCGNEVEQTQVITVQDTTDPELSGVPADATVECNAVPVAAQPTASDNCDTNVELSFSEVRTDGNCIDNYTLTRTWTATDNCGNETIETQVITVQDTTDPELVGVPSDIAVECDAVPVPAQPSAADNCDADVEITFTEIRTDGSCSDTYTLTRTWTAIDNCGNEDIQTQVITVEDTTDPELSGVPSNTTVECDEVPTLPQPTASDNCDTDVEITFAEIRTDGDCLDSYTLTRTWTATDNCGNEATQTQVITVQDTTDPDLVGVPTDVTVECNAVPAPANPIASDNCDTDVEITFAEVRTDGSCSDSYTLTRTWTALDNCGNETVGTQVITVQDTEEPSLSGVPADATVQCNEVPAPAQPNATDNCDTDVEILFAEIRTDGDCVDSYTLTRTWTAIDNCGNEDVQTQTIIVEDTEAPNISGVPADATVECDAVPAAAQPTASDDCDTDVEILFSEVRTDGSCSDSYTLTRTWTAVDNCGNETVETQVITVEDTTNPVLSGVPTDETVECDAVPIAAQPSATDNCDTNVEILFSEVQTDGDCASGFTITRTWTATDNCGNTAEETQVITVQDTEDPTISGVPTDVTVECDAIPTPAEPTATDNCDTDVEITFSEIRTDGNCSENYTLTRTWTATDDCGNSVEGVQVITVQDTQDPALSGVPADMDVECSQIPVPAEPTATDNCDTDVEILFSEVQTDGVCENTYTLTRTWTAVDNCGNETVETQVINVQDTEEPVLSGIPANTSVECDQVPVAAEPTATDNCDTNVEITFSEVRTDGDCSDSYILTRTWTAIDNCGNSEEGIQVITVEDTTDPIISGVPADESVECDAVPAPAQPTVTDNCDTNVELTFTETETPGSCSDNYIITREWEAVDNCGNTSTLTQVITVGDNTDPILSGVPADVAVECDAIPAPAQPTATDNCDTDVEITYSEVRTDGDCSDSYTLTRTWIAIDDCGNQNAESQIINVEDTTDPVLSGVPTDIAVDCNEIPMPANPTATDNCDTNVEILFEETTIGGACSDTYIIERRWTAVDNCGNEVVGVQNISVEDTTNPTLSGIPSDITAECDNVPAAPGVDEIIGSDNCDVDVEISFSESIQPGSCADNYIITRTWTATDNCGNETSGTQIVTVIDETDPVLSGVPANVTVDCDDLPDIPVINDDITATDNCDVNVMITFSETIAPGDCEDSYEITRTWTATDNCGNTTEGSQIIVVGDDSPPVISGVPANVTVECGNIPAPANPTATDSCDDSIEIEFSEVRTDGNCIDNYTLTRTWAAIDNCGNVTSQSQVIIVEDLQDPVLSGVPVDMDVECDGVPPPPANDVIVATDNCDTDVEIIFEEIITAGGCTNNYTITRVWTAVDNCGNQVVGTQLISVGDNEGPELTGVPVDVTVECGNIPTPVNPVATDACDADVEIAFSEVQLDGSCENEYSLIRTWTATDNCGNETIETQLVTVLDEIDPVLSGVPADITVDCDAIPNPPSQDDIIATDNCDADVEVIFEETSVTGNCASSTVITRSWTAIDNCGNSVTITQEISVSDASAPTISGVPADLTVSCDAVPNPATPTASDDCDANVELEFTESIIDGLCENSYRIERIWTAIDNCGNSISETQIISVIDDEDPVLSGVPADLTVDCSDVPPAPDNTSISATDNCDTDVEVLFAEVANPGSCTDSYTITRTWTAVDNCGNETTQSQVITIEDNTPPTLSNVAADITVDCGNIPDADAVVANDDCDIDVEVTFEETILDAACEDAYTMIRTWIATDNCGNSVEAEQMITVEDNLVPDLIGVPADLAVDLSAGEQIPDPAQVIGNDNCDTNVEIEFNEVSIDNGCQIIITRTWTAIDNCGNTNSASQVITASDVLTVSIEPANNFVCQGNQVIYSANVQDPSYEYTWTVDGGSFDNPTDPNPTYTGTEVGTFTITLIVSNGQGCEGSATATITVLEAPVATVDSNGPICEGDNLELIATGGNNYQWSGPNGFTSTEQNPIIENATPDNSGEYTVMVFAGDCSVPLTIEVEVNDELTVDYNAGNADCNSVGFINLGVNGGTGNYTYDWADLPGTDNQEDRDDLIGGTYSVTITDEGGCIFEIDAILILDNCSCDAVSGGTDPTATTICLENGNASLAGIADGSAIVPPGFSIVYLLSSDITGEVLEINNTPEFEVNETGIYSIHAFVYDPTTFDLNDIQIGVTSVLDIFFALEQGGGDICGAIEVSATPITVTDVTAIVEFTTPENCDQCDGTASLLPVNLDYVWSDGGVGANRQDLCNGSYTVTATNVSTGCSTELTVAIQEDCNNGCTPPEVLNTVVVESTCGNLDGSVSIEVLGNVNDYDFNWIPSIGTPGANGDTRSDLPAGVYAVVITDLSTIDCTTEISFTVGNVDGPEVEDIIVNPATCNDANGSVTLLPANYEYTWFFDQAQTNNRNDLAPGTYQVFVVDPINPSCVDVVSVEVGILSALQAEAIINTQPECGTANGAVTITLANGGAGNITYEWSDGGSGAERDDLASGLYVVVVTDQATGCEAIVSFTLVDDVPAATVVITNDPSVTCLGEMDGSVIYSVSTAPDFEMPFSESIVDIDGTVYSNNNLSAGEYCILITDANGCLAGQNCFEVTEPDAIDVDVEIENKDCDNDGAITLIVSGGNGGYTFDWSDLSGTNDPQNRNDLQVGDYGVIITDSEGCFVAAQNLSVLNTCTDCETPVIDNIVVIESTCGNSDGQAAVVVEGNANDYDYAWSPNVSTSETATDIEAGTYTVTVSTAGNASCFIIETFVVGNADGPSVESVNTTPATCADDNGTANIIPANFDYTWSDGPSGDFRIDLTAGIYQVTMTDPATGCFNVFEVEIESFNTLSADVQILDLPECGVADGAVSLSIGGGSGNYTVAWSDGGSGTDRSGLAAGVYAFTVTDNNGSGCIVEETFILENEVDGAAEILITNTPVMVSCIGAADGDVEFTIDFLPGFVQPATTVILDNSGAIAADEALAAGTYCIVVTDGNDCIAGQNCFEVIEPTLIDVDVMITNADCNGPGGISLSVSGGNGGYTFDWEDLPGMDDPQDRASLNPGVYNLTVTDVNGCQAVVNNLTIADDCIPCPFAETVYLEVEVDDMITQCIEIEDCFETNQTDIVLQDGGLNGNSGFGTWTLDASGCLTYESLLLEGDFVDTVCVLANYNGLVDTTCFIFSISNTPLSNPDLDTIPISTLEETPFTDCLPLDELNGNFASIEVWYGPLNGTGSLMVDPNAPCFTYTPFPGQTGNAIDTMAVIICDDLGVCDTTIIVSSVIPAGCPEVFTEDTVNITVTECFEFGFYCMPILPSDLNNYQIFDNGEVYIQGFTVCDFDSILLYATQIITSQAPDGPYELINWTENGENHSIPVFADLQELVDSMNVWDPAGNWILNSDDQIEGGTSASDYGILEINQIPAPSLNFPLTLTTIQFANGVQIAADTGFHEIIINEILTGCQDTIYIDVECTNTNCPDIYTGPEMIMAVDCDSLTDLCLNIPLEDILNYTILDNGVLYETGFNGCNFDSLITYLSVGYNQPGNYTLDSWTVNGQVFSIPSFTSLDQLIDSMNVWDPNANWQQQGILIVGGDFSNVYGDIIVSQFGGVIATSNPSIQLVPNGLAMAIDTGAHQIIVTDTTTGCTDVFNVTITCDPANGISVDTLLTVFEGMSDTFCIDASNLGTISSIVNVCPGASDGNVSFMIIPGTTCVEYTGDVLGIDTFCVEICDFNLGICDTTSLIVEVLPQPDTIVVDLLLGFSDTICIDTTSLPGNIVSFNNFCFQDDIDFFLNEDTYCVEFMGIDIGTDTLCIQICDDLGFCDETYIIVNISPQTIDTVSTEIMVGSSTIDTICLDTTELAGTIVSINNYCLGASGTFVDFDILDDFCISFEGLMPEGIDSACIEICDEFGFCDTTVFVVNTIQNMSIDPPVAVDDDTITVTNTPVEITVLENDTLNSTLIDIGIVDGPENGSVVINPDFGITYFPDPEFCGEIDSFTYFITTLGGSDTATVYIEVLCDELVIYNGISPNGDGINDVFTISGIENFPTNTVCIFNRWGNQVFLRKGYTNDDPFTGEWSGKSLPDGTYFYLVEIEDEEGNTQKFNGYLQIHR